MLKIFLSSEQVSGIIFFFDLPTTNKNLGNHYSNDIRVHHFFDGIIYILKIQFIMQLNCL
jgi:hypothetical protein